MIICAARPIFNFIFSAVAIFSIYAIYDARYNKIGNFIIFPDIVEYKNVDIQETIESVAYIIYNMMCSCAKDIYNFFILTSVDTFRRFENDLNIVTNNGVSNPPDPCSDISICCFLHVFWMT